MNKDDDSSMNEDINSATGISILIPAYQPNIDDITKILSILSTQTNGNFEIVIANDGDDFFESIKDVVSSYRIPFQYKKNEKRLGLYSSIKENIQYCHYDHILVLEQDIIPISRDYVKSLAELFGSCQTCVVTSKLLIDVNTSYKKYVFYKRRISNLETIDRSKTVDNFNGLVEAEVTFTKADLLNKQVLLELFSLDSSNTNTNTAQDIIMSSIIRRNNRLVTGNGTACEIGHSDPDSISFFLKKEYLYGKSVLDVWKYSDKKVLRSTNYFKEKLARVLFVIMETVAIVLLGFAFLIGTPIIQLILLVVVLGFAILYSQLVLLQIDFWSFSRKNSGRLAKFFSSTFYIVLLDMAYTLGILRRLL